MLKGWWALVVCTYVCALQCLADFWLPRVFCTWSALMVLRCRGVPWCKPVRGGRRVSYQSADWHLRVKFGWCEASAARSVVVGICVLDVMARWWMRGRWLPCTAAWYCEMLYVQLFLFEELSGFTILLWWDSAVVYRVLKKKKMLCWCTLNASGA